MASTFRMAALGALALAYAGCAASPGSIDLVWVSAKATARTDDEMLSSGLGPRQLNVVLAVRSGDCALFSPATSGLLNGQRMTFRNGSYNIVEGCGPAVFEATVDLAAASGTDAAFVINDGVSSLNVTAHDLLVPRGPLAVDPSSGNLEPLPGELRGTSQLTVRWTPETQPMSVAVAAVDAFDAPLVGASMTHSDSVTADLTTLEAGPITFLLSGMADLSFDCAPNINCSGTISSSYRKVVSFSP